MNRLSATGFALCDEQPGCPRSRYSSSITSPRWRALPPASQAARSLMAREKQMPLSASLFFFRARASLLRSRARADALYRLLSQAARSLMAREKQMPLSASLVFLSCSLYSTIGLKGNTVNGMTFKPIQIWYYGSLVVSWEQISRLRENLLPGNYEGSAIS